MTKTTKTNTQYTVNDFSIKENKKNTVYSANNNALCVVFASKKTCVVYVHENVHKLFVNAQHKSTIASVLAKYSATENKNYSDKDKYQYRVSMSLDTLETFLSDIKKACAVTKCEVAVKSTESAQSKSKSASTKRKSKSATKSTESVSESAQSESTESAESESAS